MATQGTATAIAGDRAREALTRSVTCLLTASLIVDPRFPTKRHLPSAAASPFSSHGHLLQLDYKLMLQATWQVIGDIQERVRKWSRKRTHLALYSLLVAGIGALLVAQVQPPLALLIITVGFFGCYAASKALWLEPLEKDIAAIRAEAIRKLLNGIVQIDTANETVKKIADGLSRIGDGALGQSEAPVLTILDDAHPFPGYGRLQTDMTYVCPPKKDSGKEDFLNVPDLRRKVSQKVIDAVESSGIADVTFGEVLVVHGRSVSMESPLLVTEPNGEKAPLLWYDKLKVDEIAMNAAAASPRVYFAIEVLFPQYMTVATFFTRPFLAGHAAAYQVAVTTLGPPTETWAHILRQLMQHKIEESEQGKRAEVIETTPDDERISLLRSLQNVSRSGVRFQSPTVDAAAIKKLEAFQDHSEPEYDQAVKRLASESTRWPGYYYKHSNWREDNSFTFTTDFFGRPEALASVRALYNLISKSILDGLEALEFDISDYKDKEGGYSINADKIDHLVVGERIYVGKKPEDGEKQSGDKGK